MVLIKYLEQLLEKYYTIYIMAMEMLLSLQMHWEILE